MQGGFFPQSKQNKDTSSQNASYNQEKERYKYKKPYFKTITIYLVIVKINNGSRIDIFIKTLRPDKLLHYFHSHYLTDILKVEIRYRLYFNKNHTDQHFVLRKEITIVKLYVFVEADLTKFQSLGAVIQKTYNDIKFIRHSANIS